MDTNKTHHWTARGRLTLSNVDRAKVRRPHSLHQDTVYYNWEGQLQRRMNVQVENPGWQRLRPTPTEMFPPAVTCPCSPGPVDGGIDYGLDHSIDP
jgi:hypothetical protein